MCLFSLHPCSESAFLWGRENSTFTNLDSSGYPLSPAPFFCWNIYTQHVLTCSPVTFRLLTTGSCFIMCHSSTSKEIWSHLISRRIWEARILSDWTLVSSVLCCSSQHIWHVEISCLWVVVRAKTCFAHASRTHEPQDASVSSFFSSGC